MSTELVPTYYRLIPACAEQTAIVGRAAVLVSAHPRVRGADGACDANAVMLYGSSPRARSRQ